MRYELMCGNVIATWLIMFSQSSGISVWEDGYWLANFVWAEVGPLSKFLRILKCLENVDKKMFVVKKINSDRGENC